MNPSVLANAGRKSHFHPCGTEPAEGLGFMAFKSALSLHKQLSRLHLLEVGLH